MARIRRFPGTRHKRDVWRPSKGPQRGTIWNFTRCGSPPGDTKFQHCEHLNSGERVSFGVQGSARWESHGLRKLIHLEDVAQSGKPQQELSRCLDVHIASGCGEQLCKHEIEHGRCGREVTARHRWQLRRRRWITSSCCSSSQAL